MNLIMNNKDKINAFLIVTFIFMSSITLPLKQFGGEQITLIITIILLGVTVVVNKKISLQFLVIFIVMMCLLALNLLLVDYKSLLFTQIIDIVKFSIIPLLLATNIFDLKKFIDYYYWYSIVNFMVMLTVIPSVIDREFSYMSLGVYMSYSLIAFIIRYFQSKKRIWNLTLIIITFLIILLFGNRGSLIVCSAFILFMFLYYEKNQIKIFLMLSAGTLFGLFINFNLGYILREVNEYLLKIGIRSYAVHKYIMMLDKGLIEASSGRGNLANEATEIILKNPLMPHGIGYYTKVTGNVYPHNVLLDLLIVFGLIGMIFVLIWFGTILRNIKYIDDKNFKALILMLLIFVIFRLWLSGTFITEKILWILIGMLISLKRREFIKYNV